MSSRKISAQFVETDLAVVHIISRLSTAQLNALLKFGGHKLHRMGLMHSTARLRVLHNDAALLTMDVMEWLREDEDLFEMSTYASFKRRCIDVLDAYQTFLGEGGDSRSVPVNLRLPGRLIDIKFLQVNMCTTVEQVVQHIAAIFGDISSGNACDEEAARFCIDFLGRTHDDHDDYDEHVATIRNGFIDATDIRAILTAFAPIMVQAIEHAKADAVMDNDDLCDVAYDMSRSLAKLGSVLERAPLARDALGSFKDAVRGALTAFIDGDSSSVQAAFGPDAVAWLQQHVDDVDGQDDVRVNGQDDGQDDVHDDAQDDDYEMFSCSAHAGSLSLRGPRNACPAF